MPALESFLNRVLLPVRPHHAFPLQPFRRTHTELSGHGLECALHAGTGKSPAGRHRQEGEIEALSLLQQRMGQGMSTRLFKARCQLNGAGGIVAGHHRIHERATQGERSGLVKDHALNGRGLLDHISAPEQPALACSQS